MKPSRADEPLLFAEAWQFGDVRIDPGRHLLQLRGEAVEIEPKPFALLIALAEARGDVVDKRDLLERLWPRQLVTDAVLNQCVLRARQAIGDDDHRVIVTVHRHGYRIGPAVEAVAGAASASSPASALSRHRRAGWTALALLGVAGALALAAWSFDGGRQAAPRAPSVAVMPIETSSANADVQRIASGLGDALLTRLAQEASLRVPARTSVRAAAEHRADVRRVGRELGVEHVFEAVLDEAGNGYVLHASLVRGSDGFQEWARRFDVPDGGLAVAEAAIADAVIAALDGHAPGSSSSAIGTDSDQAYRAYLRGRALWHQRTEAALRWAIENDEAALAIDPQFARAHADLATAWMLLYEYSNLSLEDARRAAEPHVRSALRLAPGLAEAQAANGLLLLDGGEAIAAERALRKAVAAAPNDATFLMWLGTSLTYQGRVSEAAAWHDKALALDPLSAVAHVYVGVDRALAGDAGAGSRFERAIALDPRLPESYWQYALAERFAGRTAAARELLERALALDPSSEYTRAMLADTLLELRAPQQAATVLRGGGDGSLAAWLRSAAAVARANGDDERALVYDRLSVDRAMPLPDDRLLAAAAQARLGRRVDSLASFERLLAGSAGNEPIVRLWQADLGAPDVMLYLDLVREQRGAAAARTAADAVAARLQAMRQGGVRLPALDALLDAVRRYDVQSKPSANSRSPTNT